MADTCQVRPVYMGGKTVSPAWELECIDPQHPWQQGACSQDGAWGPPSSTQGGLLGCGGRTPGEKAPACRGLPYRRPARETAPSQLAFSYDMGAQHHACIWK